MSSQEFEFVPPPEAPTFRPTWEEFQDALQYINKIRPIAEQYGICKIIPPPDWQPPFAVDVDNFKFTPRIQRINELEAHTRIKLNFLDQIAKFWELQGSSLKIPVLEKKALDLYSLHKRVQDAGGADAVTRHRGWNRISTSLGFASNKNLGSQLKHLYDKILKPFEIFNRSKEMPLDGDKANTDDDPDYVAEPRDYKPHQIPSRMAGKIPDNEKNGRRSRRYQSSALEDDEEEGNQSNNKELRKLQFKGPGPKNADVDKEAKSKGRNRKMIYYDDPLAKYICLNCGRGDAEEHMLLCDGCDDSYHTFCLVPTLTEIPKGDWRCPKCVAVEVSKPLEAFGFEQAQKEYTLQSFGEMADKFKQDYFNMPVHLVPLDMAEQEFWRIVSSIDEDVTVEYGADLHTMDHGSGFPTNKSSNLMPADQEYANDSWNLNNLPVHESSVLAHIGCDISGMKVPWMYVGMCFSTFCWHNEDHWSYSINYLHWGEPKTWYGVPGGEAEKFEECMKAAAPELFQTQPDLLHQLVTIMNPNILMKGNVPIVRCDQHAGEFMITFPRSYHAGFNQGYNFAEAVNFAPPDWLPIGRECISHYSKLKRYCVFSHDELVCKMSCSAPENLDLTVAAATYQDMLKMVDSEKKLRRALLHWGVTSAEREAFELLPDDERQCEFCKTTCFLSAGKYLTFFCRYRYTLDELPPMLQHLKERAESFDNWASKVKQALEAKQPQSKLELDDLKELVGTAEEQRFPDSELLGALVAAVAEAEKCAAVAGHLAAKKVRTRTRGCGDPKSRLTLEELRLFHDQISSLACVIKEEEGVRQLLETVLQFQEDAAKVLKDSEEWMVNWKVERLEEEEEMEGEGKRKGRKKKKDGRSEEEEKKEIKEEKPVEKMDVDGNDNNEVKECKVEESKDKVKKIEEESDDEEDDLQSEKVGRLLELGNSLDIDLPELPLLKHRHQKVLWLEEVQEALEDPSCVVADVVKTLMDKSLTLPPHRRIEATRTLLYQLLNDINEWDSKAASLLQAKDSSIEEADALLAEAKKIPASMPSVNALRDAAKKAREWTAKAAVALSRDDGKVFGDELMSDQHSGEMASVGGPRAQLLEVVEAMLHRARPIPLKLPHLEALEEQVASTHIWLERTSKTFLKKNSSHYSLIEVLVPRTDIGLSSGTKKSNKRFKREESVLMQASSLLDITPDKAAKSSSLVQAYKDCSERELRAMRAIRSHNLNKKTSPDEAAESPDTFCVCHKPHSDSMQQCTICCDFFHPSCVVLQVYPQRPLVSDANGGNFVCPACYRTRRPRLETILNLLVSLQKVKMRLIEAGALQCLTERAMAWQDRALTLIRSPVIASALNTISKATSLVTEQMPSDDTSSVLWAPALGLPEKDESASKNASLNERVSALLTPLCAGPDQPLVPLPPELRRQMRDLLLEGDLLEVTVEESCVLWRLLQVSGNPVSKLGNFMISVAGGNNSPHSKKSNTNTTTGGSKKRKSGLMDPSDENNSNKSVNSKGSSASKSPPKKQKISTPKNSASSDPALQPPKKILKKASNSASKLPDAASNKKKDIQSSQQQQQSGQQSNQQLTAKKRASNSSSSTANGHALQSGQTSVKNSPKKNSSGTKKANKKQSKAKSSTNTDSTSSSDDDEMCAAAVCKIPVGTAVDWVQCDACNEWFHYVCVGLKHLDEDEDYNCGKCAKNPPNKQSSSSLTAAKS